MINTPFTIQDISQELMSHMEISDSGVPESLLNAYNVIFNKNQRSWTCFNITDEDLEQINELITKGFDLISELENLRLPTRSPNEYVHLLNIKLAQDNYQEANKTGPRRKKLKKLPKINCIWAIPQELSTSFRRAFKIKHHCTPEQIRAAGIFYMFHHLLKSLEEEKGSFMCFSLVNKINATGQDIIKNRKQIAGANKAKNSTKPLLRKYTKFYKLFKQGEFADKTEEELLLIISERYTKPSFPDGTVEKFLHFANLRIEKPNF